MPKNLPSNEFWGRRSGYYCPYKPKGQKHAFGFCIQQSQWGSGPQMVAVGTRKIKTVNQGKAS